MEFLFLKSVNMNIVLSWIIIAIFFTRVILRKKSKQVCFSLWGILCFKFFIPFSFECRWSLIPSIETFNIEDIYNRSFVKYKKQSKSVFLISVGLLLIVAVCFLTNPENSNRNILELLKAINN